MRLLVCRKIRLDRFVKKIIYIILKMVRIIKKTTSTHLLKAATSGDPNQNKHSIDCQPGGLRNEL